MKKLFTSESITEGHPDKIADQVADAVLDALLEQDPMSRCACEVATTTGLVFVMGEVSSKAKIDVPKIVRETIRKVGYLGGEAGFDANACAVMVALDEQSPDISMGVTSSLEQRTKDGGDELSTTGAGDQGMMFGYATKETKNYMPLALELSHQLTKQLATVRKTGVLPYLYPDGKAQVTVEYEDGVPKRIDTVVVSSQHSSAVEMKTLQQGIYNEVILKVIPQNLMDGDTKVLINPTGRFVVGGPQGDSGVTGRKIIVDSYGGYCPHGGGAYSGKDPTKVDRSAAYYARYVAKNMVAAGLADILEIQVAYAIGKANPVSIAVNTFGTGKKTEEELVDIISKHFDFRPAAIIQKLDLRRPIYSPSATYGHFGRDEFPWEQLDMVDALKAL